MNRTLLVTIALGLTTALSFAQGAPVDGPSSGTPVVSGPDKARQIDFTRDVLSKMGVDQLLGHQVPGDVPFTDEHGRTIKFGDLYGKRPIVIMPMYFTCKSVCGIQTDNLLQTAIQMTDLNVGRDYDIVLLSINPKETPDLTLPRWTSTVKLYGRPEAEWGFHFLTGSYTNIRKITDSLGFKYDYEPDQDMINHPAGLMVLSPKGIVTGYLVNKEFPIIFMKHLLADARVSKVSPKTESILFGCIMIDKSTERRSLVIENVIRLCAGIFAVGVAFWIVGMSLSGNKGKAKGGPA